VGKSAAKSRGNVREFQVPGDWSSPSTVDVCMCFCRKKKDQSIDSLVN